MRIFGKGGVNIFSKSTSFGKFTIRITQQASTDILLQWWIRNEANPFSTIEALMYNFGAVILTQPNLPHSVFAVGKSWRCKCHVCHPKLLKERWDRNLRGKKTFQVGCIDFRAYIFIVIPSYFAYQQRTWDVLSDIVTILHLSALNYFGFFNADKFVKILFRPWLSVLAHANLNLHNSSNVHKNQVGQLD